MFPMLLPSFLLVYSPFRLICTQWQQLLVESNFSKPCHFLAQFALQEALW